MNQMKNPDPERERQRDRITLGALVLMVVGIVISLTFGVTPRDIVGEVLFLSGACVFSAIASLMSRMIRHRR